MTEVPGRTIAEIHNKNGIGNNSRVAPPPIQVGSASYPLGDGTVIRRSPSRSASISDVCACTGAPGASATTTATAANRVACVMRVAQFKTMWCRTPILPLAGRNRYEKKRVASSPVPDTAYQSAQRRQVRLVIRVDDGLGCRLHPLQRLCQTLRRAP